MPRWERRLFPDYQDSEIEECGGSGRRIGGNGGREGNCFNTCQVLVLPLKPAHIDRGFLVSSLPFVQEFIYQGYVADVVCPIVILSLMLKVGPWEKVMIVSTV
jgi:hypothetical protein